MASFWNTTQTYREIIQMASLDLDSRQLRLISPLSPSARLELMFQLCEFMQELAFQVERQETPEASDEEIEIRLRKRVRAKDD